MSDTPAQVTPPEVAPTTKVRILKALREVPEEGRTETLVTVAECLLESSGKAVRSHMTATDALKEIAQFVPTDSIGAILPQPVRIAFAEVIEGLGLTRQAQAPAQTPSATPPPPVASAATVLVETAGDKEIRERTIIVGGVKMLRVVGRPYNVLYPHFWLGGEKYLAWKCTYDELMVGKKLPDHCLFKQRQCLTIIESWFDVVAAITPPPTVDTCPAHIVRIFNANIALLLEMYLLGGGHLSGSPAAATACFAGLLEERAHSGATLNYYEDLKKSKEAKNFR